MKDHLANSCPENITPCRQAENGCTWQGRRASLGAHVDKCPYESIKGFFAIHSVQMAQLSKDNDCLRRRTDELEGTVRILRQELEWAKIALGPWCRPVYPERPSMSASYGQFPDDGDGTRSEPNRFGPMVLPGVGPTGGTSRPEPRMENDATETFDFFDPFSFIGQGQNQVSSIHATNNGSIATGVSDTDSNTNTPSSNANGHAIDSHNVRDLNRDTTYESGPSGSGSLNGSGSIHNATVIALSPGASNLQSTSAAPPVPLFSDHFPSEDQAAFEGGSSSRTQGRQHVPSPPVSTPSNSSPGIHPPVSITVPST